MNAIDFVVRTPVGANERGLVSASDRGYLIDASNGREVSLNLGRSDLRGYDRAGQDLMITLADGRVIVLENYFGPGEPGQLYISADGVLTHVAFVEAEGGVLFAQYGDVSEWGKWSPDDALIFFDRPEVVVAEAVVAEEESGVSMLAAGLLAGGGILPFLGAGAAVATGAAVIGGGGDDSGSGGGDGGLVGSDGDGGDDSGPRPPTVNDGEYVIGGDDVTDEDRVIVVGGTANPGDTVEVTVGDKTGTTTTGSDGNWQVEFSGPNFPGDGSYTAIVIVTGGTSTTLTGPTILIDTTPPPVLVTGGTTSTGQIITDFEFDGGATVTGTTEAGATVVLIAGGVSHVADVDAQGNWNVTLSSTTFERGEYTTSITITATDSFGNSRTITDGIQIDTVSNVTLNTSIIETDGIINADERSDGVQITGTTDIGSTVIVEMNGYSHQAVVSANGSWSVTFAATEIPLGERSLVVTATATDAVGNVSTTSGQVVLDTFVRDFDITSQAGGADQVVNAAEAAQGLTVTGTTEPGASVVVTLGGVSRSATVTASGTWSVTYLAGELPSGEQTVTLTARSTDLAGNVATETRSVVFDTDAGLLTISPDPVETDDIINAAEASDGVTLTGTSTPFQMVEVTLDGVTKSVRTDAAGIWRATYLSGEIRPGEYDAQITAHTVDAAGNELTRTDTVRVDTFVRNFQVSANPVTADNVVNNAEQGQGVTLSGTTEPGASLVVTLAGVTRTANVSASGNWSVTFSAADIPDGTYVTTAQISTQDAAGNTATTTKTFRVDTEVTPLSMTSTPGGADQVVNEAETAQGFVLTGQVEQGSGVTVTIGGTTLVAQVTSGGIWSVNVPSGVIPTANGASVDIGVSATDAAGNTRTITQQMMVDNVAPDSPDMASITRDDTQLVRGITLEASESDIAIGRVTGAGSVQNVGFTEVDIPAIGETQFIFNQVVPDGSHLVVTGTDAAGNRSGTYIVLDDPNTTQSNVTVAGNLSQHDIRSIDLEFTDQASLTITEAQIVSLSNQTNDVRVLGNSDDAVQITGAVRTGRVSENGTSFNVYELGDANILIDEDITQVSTI